MLRSKEFRAHLAQLVEHILGKDEVTGSIPVVGSISEFTNRVILQGGKSDGEEEIDTSSD